MSVNLRRVLRFALTDFYRNKGIAISAIFVLTVTTLLVTGLVFVHGVSNYLIVSIQNKIDITAYFKEDTEEQDILDARDEIAQNPNIKSVEYISKDKALATFLERHKDSSALAQAITELGNNPFLPSLNIVTQGDSSQYEEVAKILQSGRFANIIEKVDFSEKKATIEKVFSVTKSINRTGLVLGFVLIIVAILVVFNTVKLIINSSKDEIGTMRIVGASDWFIKAPFLIEGGIFGLIAFIISLILTILTVFSLSYFLLVMLPGFSLIEYFTSNFLFIILVQLLAGVGLGVLSSFIVVRKYLDV